MSGGSGWGTAETAQNLPCLHIRPQQMSMSFFGDKDEDANDDGDGKIVTIIIIITMI